MLINSGHTCLFQKGVFTVYLGDKKENVVTMPHIAQRKHKFWGEIKHMYKTKRIALKKKVFFEILHQRLSHISTR